MIYKHTSPNYNERPPATKIDTIILHHTEMESLEAAIDRLCSPKYKVSSHYIISKTGEIYSLVPIAKRAWHAGVSSWKNYNNINDISIGIELDNNGYEYFTVPQMTSLMELCLDLIKKYDIPQQNILSHHEVAPMRKQDPGPFFEWEYLAKCGVGVFPVHQDDIYKENPQKLQVNLLALQKRLRSYGYYIEATGFMDQNTIACINSFRRRFCRNTFIEGVTSIWDLEAELKLNQLIA